MGLCAARLIAGLALLAGLPAAGDTCAADTLELHGKTGVQVFHIEIADTADERATGLMHRGRLASSAGMLFVYPAPQHVRFWMKNTLIPLDMVFADASGTVTRVHENAVPQDLAPIDGGEGVRYVLEINGGLAGPMGIAPGSRMRAAALDQSVAALPCSGG